MSCRCACPQQGKQTADVLRHMAVLITALGAAGSRVHQDVITMNWLMRHKPVRSVAHSLWVQQRHPVQELAEFWSLDQEPRATQLLCGAVHRVHVRATHLLQESQMDECQERDFSVPMLNRFVGDPLGARFPLPEGISNDSIY
eukprot:356868-Chlamydomonas_euryale.AAC.17